jgi:hypothetical protein
MLAAPKPLFLSSSIFRGAASLALSTTLLACVIDDSPPRRVGATGMSNPPSADPVGGSAPDSPASASPMLVVVDTVVDPEQVMHADGGQGVGVFAEYWPGGKWHVWWTCDTARSLQSCDVAVAATVATGAIGAIDSEELQGGTLTTPDPSRVEVRITTTNQIHGIWFDTTPGVVLTLEATVGGLKEGPSANHSFFFFLQNGKINGGYDGPLTNPLQLQGNKP